MVNECKNEQLARYHVARSRLPFFTALSQTKIDTFLDNRAKNDIKFGVQIAIEW